jgi:zinc D-Ala-D-Ala carboxypeptidase
MPKKLSPNFTLEELIFSQTATRLGIDNTPTPKQVAAMKALCVNLLQPIRDRIGLSIVVNSGFRSPMLNRAVSGAVNSQHLEGRAADIVCHTIGTKELFKRIAAMKLPFDQLIYEGGRNSQWVHISYAGKKARKEILAASFPESGGVLYRKLSKSEIAFV